MSKLKNQLSNWVNNELITLDQQQSILKYEETHQGPSKVLFGFLILGFSIIGIGIISLIAANWVAIPSSIKIAADFILLLGVAKFAYSKRLNGNEVAYEIASGFLMFLFLGTIGLISQIYHTGGELHQALIFWCLITAILAYISNRSFIPYLWCAGFFGSLLLMLFNRSFLFLYYGKSAYLFFLCLPFLSALMTLTIRHFKGRESPQYKVLFYWSVQWLFLGLIGMETIGKYSFPKNPELSLYLPGYLLSIVVMLCISLSKELKSIQKSLLLIICVAFILPFHLVFIKDLPLFLIKPSITILCLTCLALFCASIKSHKLFQKLLVIIGIRFLILYFQAFGGLAYTGFGLIFSGLVLIGAVFLWNKYRQEIQNWAEGMVTKS